MRFEEVREMEESPMDEDVLEELCFPYSAASMISDVYAVLILRYYQKYDERYGTHLTRGMEIPQIVPGRDTGYEEESIWLEEIPGVMDRAIYSSGWNIAWISTETEGLQEALEGQKNEDEEKKGLPPCLWQLYGRNFPGRLREILFPEGRGKCDGCGEMP